MIILFFFFERRNIINDRPPPLKKYLYCYTYLSKKKIFFSLFIHYPPPTYTYLAPISVQIFYGYILPPQLHEICSLQNVTKYFLFLVYYYINIAKFCEMRIIITMGYTVPIFKGAIFQSNKKYTVSLYFIIIKVC